MVSRHRHVARVAELLRTSPVVAVLGARQVGKTTLARAVASGWGGPVTRFDLEDPRDLARLSEPTLTLDGLRGLIVLDEVQRAPGLFPVLRVLADRPRRPARFLLLGSASPDLLRQGSETLAGRIAFHPLDGLALDETGAKQARRLWLRGGFPRSYLARSDRESAEWRRAFVTTFVERDLPQLGISIPGATMRRFWTMLAHHHAQIWNASELARAFAVSDATVRRHLDSLTSALVVRQLAPWHENVGKRQVKSPKIYVADSGLVHTLLDIETMTDLERHPKLGASFEGFVIVQLVQRLGARAEQCFFWRTHAGAELDLLVIHRGRRLGFEIKRTDAPGITASMRSAIDTLRLDSLDVVHAGDATFALGDGVRAVALARLHEDVRPLRQP